MTEIGEIFLKGLIFIAMVAFVITGFLFVIGETIEHFTP